MPEISIIMPSYNVGKYIEECLESVVFQTFTDLEILCIDAGSTDGTLEIINQYAARDKRVKLIRSEKKSYGYQVNKGIELAKGRYIGIVETDDFIEPDMYEALHFLMTVDDVDFVKTGTRFCFDIGFGERFEINSTGMESSLFSDGKEQIMIEPGSYRDILWMDHHIWNGLYDSKLLKKIRLSDTPGAAYQDTGFMFQMYTSASKGIFINRSLYHYRRTNAEASAYDTTSFSKLLYEYMKILNNIEYYGPLWRRALMIKLFVQIRVKFRLMGLQGEFWREAEEEIDRMSHNIFETLSEENFPKRLREDAILFRHDPYSLFEKFLNFYSTQKEIIKDMITMATDRRVALFGAGFTCDFVGALLKAQGILPAYVCDNSDEKQGMMTFCGRICKAVDALNHESGLLFIITARSQNSKSVIREQLMSLGVSKDDIFTYTAGTSSLLLLS